MSQPQKPTAVSVNRRQLLQIASGAAAGACALAAADPVRAEKAVTKGRVKHSIVQWCFADYWNLEQMCQVANQLGCLSIELIAPEHWPTLKKHGLTCAISPSHLFVQGMNNPRYQDGCIEMLKQRIDQCAEAGVKTAITFTGYAEESGEWNNGDNPDLSKLPAGRRVIDPDEGLKNCVAGFRRVVGYAEKKQINLAIEMLNTRASDHPMKGHPGYQGNHVDYCMQIINQVGSPRLGMLFDIYHVQIMDGDIIRRIREHKDYIGHVHVAGNPGRGELDDRQEIRFKPIMEALVDIGYRGYVGHEYIPTREPMKGLVEAVSLCDV